MNFLFHSIDLEIKNFLNRRVELDFWDLPAPDIFCTLYVILEQVCKPFVHSFDIYACR